MPTTNVNSYLRRNGERVSSHSRGFEAGAPQPSGWRQAGQTTAAAGIAVLGIVSGLLEFVASLIGLVNAVIVLVTVIIGGLAGYKGRHKIRRGMRKVTRRTGRVVRAVKPPKTPSQIDAYTRRKLAKKQLRHERSDVKWTQRRERVGGWWLGRQSKAMERRQQRLARAENGSSPAAAALRVIARDGEKVDQ